MSAADVPSSGDAPPVNIDLIDPDALVGLDDIYVTIEVHHMLCKDFIRKMCDKGSNCKYSHVLTLEHLGVYTFCHKYQYSACSAETCEYLHASPQEEKVFYETGAFTSPELQHLNLIESTEQGEGLSTDVPDRYLFVMNLLDKMKITVPQGRGNDTQLKEKLKARVADLLKQGLIPAASSKQRHDKGCQTSST